MEGIELYDRIDLYDRYINGMLDDKERKDFEARLKEDKEFADDFKVYLFTVDGVCREAEQDNLDFGIAMKHISKEQLREIVGKNKTDERKVAAYQPEASETKPRTAFGYRQWVWSVASIAAVIVIAFTVVLNMEKRSRYAVYDEIYASAHFEDAPSRGATQPVDITKLDDKQLMDAFPTMVKDYEESEDVDERYMYGYPLAMAYIRLHQPQPAIEVLSNLVEQMQDDDMYVPEVREMRLIIDLLK